METVQVSSCNQVSIMQILNKTCLNEIFIISDILWSGWSLYMQTNSANGQN